jgi:hypothetical protein
LLLVAAAAMTVILPAASALTEGMDTGSGLPWNIGEVNGEPRNADAPLVADEFSRNAPEGEVVTIRAGAEFPRVIGGGQSFVVHLGEIPAEHLALRLALSAPPPERRSNFADADNYALRILFNDRVVWHRWFVDTHAQLETYIPPNYVDAGDNLLVIENLGKRAAAIDAVSLERYSPGGDVLVALEGAHGQAGRIAVDVRQAVLSLDAPVGIAPDGEDRADAPINLRSAIRAFNALVQKGNPQLDEVEGARTVARWEAELAAALRRGLLPVAEVRRGDAGQEEWQSYARRYGGVVYAWVVSSEREARWLREAVEGARVYRLRYRISRHAGQADEAELFDGAFTSSYPKVLGGRVDRRAGEYRLEEWAAGRRPLPLGLRLITPPAQPVPLQRRDGHYTAETLMQFAMAGADALLVDGGLPGDKLFPSLDGEISPGWASIRPLFVLGEGRPRRSVCAVVPAEGRNALVDSNWMAVENSPTLASVAVMPSRREMGRKVRITLPVPWQGPTEGVIEGVKFGNWRRDDPLAQEPEALELNAQGSRRRASDDESGKRGQVSLELELDGLKVIRLWPRGSEPHSRERSVEGLGTAAFVAPETLHGVFRQLDLPPPSGFRYQPLREPDWLSGTMGGNHTSEVGPATHSRMAAWNTDGRMHGEELVRVPNAVPWRENSQFITFRPDDDSNYAYQLFQDSRHTWKGAWGMMVYARAVLSDPPVQRPGLPPPAPVRIWMGLGSRRGSVDLPLDEWQLIAAPYSDLISPRERCSRFYIWPDDEDKREFVLELNGFSAIYNQDNDGVQYCDSRAAIRVFKSADNMLMLVEGEPGAPAAHLLRLGHPVHVKRAAAVQPSDYSPVELLQRRESQIIELRLPALPAVEDGLSVEDTKNMFPDFRPQAGKTRVVVSLVLEP